MKKIILLFAVYCCLSGCNLNAPPNDHIPGKLDSIKIQRDTVSESQSFKGLYRKSSAQFTNCESHTTYTVKNSSLLDSLYHHLLPNAYTGEAIYVEMKAKPDPADSGAVILTQGAEIKAEQKNISKKNIE